MNTVEYFTERRFNFTSARVVAGFTERRRQAILLKTGALQSAILNSAYFSSIATDLNGVIQIFNVGAERMLGYAATDVINKITPADISDLNWGEEHRRGGQRVLD